jgi:hypothetical protein
MFAGFSVTNREENAKGRRLIIVTSTPAEPEFLFGGDYRFHCCPGSDKALRIRGLFHSQAETMRNVLECPLGRTFHPGQLEVHSVGRRKNNH